jgi:hypothetical protein
MKNEKSQSHHTKKKAKIKLQLYFVKNNFCFSFDECGLSNHETKQINKQKCIDIYQ